MSYYDILKALFRALNRVETMDAFEFEAYWQQYLEVKALGDALLTVSRGRSLKVRMMAHDYRISAWQDMIAWHARLAHSHAS